MSAPDGEAAGRTTEAPRFARRRSRTPGSGGGLRWLGEPRSAVLIILASVLVVGGGRKIRQALRARRALLRLESSEVSVEDIEGSTAHGRAGLMELFRLLSEAGTTDLRAAAGHALAVLWSRDELIPEEEKAVVRRGFVVDWKARRRYPRALRGPIPFAVEFGVPFLRHHGPGVSPTNLEWSFRVSGARRAGLEVFSAWRSGPGRAEFTIVPADFEGGGPHRLVFQSRVRTVGLTDAWELELPHVPFAFELDPRLDVASLLALPDDGVGALISRSVRLVSPEGEGTPDRVPTLTSLTETFAVLDPPVLEVAAVLPCDLAHAVEVEIAGVPGWHPAGGLVVPGAGTPVRAGTGSSHRFPLGLTRGLQADAIDRPGRRAFRVRLVADPDRGWADPDVRSIWPGTVETDRVEVEVVRR